MASVSTEESVNRVQAEAFAPKSSLSGIFHDSDSEIGDSMSVKKTNLKAKFLKGHGMTKTFVNRVEKFVIHRHDIESV
jgi:hypothetical protein